MAVLSTPVDPNRLLERMIPAQLEKMAAEKDLILPAFPNNGSHMDRKRPMVVQFPSEILKAILSYLQPIWILHSSAAYAQICSALSFENGNKVWYDTLPPSLLAEPERYQDEEQVRQAMPAAARTPLIGAQPANRFQSSTIMKRFTTIPSIRDMSDLSQSVPSQYYVQPIRVILSPLPYGRPLNQALGGVYDPTVNYQREIVGRLHRGNRCFICFEVTRRIYQKEHHLSGMLWCDDCYNEYHIKPGQVRAVPALEDLLRHSLDPIWQLRRLENVKDYYRPMVDGILTTVTGGDFEINCFLFQQLKQFRTNLSIEKSPIGRKRRTLRVELVKVAERLWTGTDEESAATYAVYRNRFAPTVMLHKFLFPDCLLYETPTALPFEAEYGWLVDPTMELKGHQAVDKALGNPTWIADKAQEMLSKLTKVMEPSGVINRFYEEKGFGYGGFVSNWIEAAEQYHIRRIELALNQGRVVTTDIWGTDTKTATRVHTLRRRIGLQDRVGVLWHGMTHHHRDRLVRLFNKIMRHGCVACPENDLLMFPRGLHSMVAHMRTSHPDRFWLSDNWLPRG